MPKNKPGRRAQSVRIIGGDWRGRRLPVAAVAGLRPTPDRVRETLFNWLREVVPGARCLDLYAGTGVLGFEALSRGAVQTVFVEHNPELITGLRQAASVLSAQAVIYPGLARDFLKHNREPFDLVFADPPYDVPLQPICRSLAGHLKPAALVYVERSSESELMALARAGQLIKNARAGAVHYGLLRPEVER
jgi:16S rRNA (guanine966-N2)-methyltransferase